MANADRAEAYKQLPPDPARALHAEAPLFDPAEKRYRFLHSGALFFVGTMAMRRDGLSRLISAICGGLLRPPCIGYYDDSAAVAPVSQIYFALELFLVMNCAAGLAARGNRSAGLALGCLSLYAPVPQGGVGGLLHLATTDARRFEPTEHMRRVCAESSVRMSAMMLIDISSPSATPRPMPSSAMKDDSARKLIWTIRRE